MCYHSSALAIHTVVNDWLATARTGKVKQPLLCWDGQLVREEKGNAAKQDPLLGPVPDVAAQVVAAQRFVENFEKRALNHGDTVQIIKFYII